MLTTVLLCTVSCVPSFSTDTEFATDILARYGYIKREAVEASTVDSEVNISLSLMLFQENYNLTVDEYLNDEILNKM